MPPKQEPQRHRGAHEERRQRQPRFLVVAPDAHQVLLVTVGAVQVDAVEGEEVQLDFLRRRLVLPLRLGVLVVEHEVQERVREYRLLRSPQDRDHVVLRLGVLGRAPVAEDGGLDALRQVVGRARDVA